MGFQPHYSILRNVLRQLGQMSGFVPLDRPKAWVLLNWEWDKDRHCWYLVIRLPLWLFQKTCRKVSLLSCGADGKLVGSCN